MKSKADHFIVGVGASAGGLKALMSLVKYLPTTDVAFSIIIAQHVSPEHKSQLVDLLQEAAVWPVEQAWDHKKLQPQVIYVTPPDYEVEIINNTIRLIDLEPSIYPAPSVNRFFNSIASDAGKLSVGVILSGTGHDGVEGIHAINEAGGLIIAQAENDAKYASMPDEARKSGFVDFSCPAAEIGSYIKSYIKRYHTVTPSKSKKITSRIKILNLLAERTGTNFSQYKPTTIDRRIEKRMQALAISDIDDYYLYIKNSPAELDKLFAIVLIGITEFFRDPLAFDKLKEKVSLHLEQAKDKVIRIWSIGCSTGEEPYSIAIILHDLLGDRIREFDIQIFATDIDHQALNSARKGFYPNDQIANLSDEHLQKYFIPTKEGFEVKNSLRQLILFARHDITVDPPFVRMDFIVCRNLLIYFNADLQNIVLPIFHYALNEKGYLFLGNAENTNHVGRLFIKSGGDEKLYVKKDDVALNTLNFNVFTKKSDSEYDPTNSAAAPVSLEEIVNETIIKAYENPYVVLDSDMSCVLIRGSLKPFLDLSDGPMNANIIKILDLKLHSEVRTLFSQVKREKLAVKGNMLPYEFSGKNQYVQLEIKPLLYAKNGKEYFLLEFNRIDAENSPYVDMELLDNPKYQNSLRILELEQELELSYKHLNTFTQELESSNEEVQTMNEELQSSNEELKSSNEELETSNEELQSINEELQTANAELNLANDNLIQKEKELLAKKTELEILNERFETVLENSKVFIAYQDLDLKYVWFNNPDPEYKNEELLGVSDLDLFKGKRSSNRFIDLKKQVLKTKKEATEEVYFSGRYWNIKVKPWLDNNDMLGVIVLSIDVTEERKAFKKLELRGSIIDALTAASKDYLLIVDHNNIIQIISEPLCEDIAQVCDIELQAGDSLSERLNEVSFLKKLILNPIQKALEGTQTKVDQFEGLASTNNNLQKSYSVQFSPILGERNAVIGAEFRGTEITNLLQSKILVQNALKRGAHLVGEEYFRDLTLQLYELFNSKSAYVGVLSDDKTNIITKAIRIDGKLSSNFIYELSEVPCEIVQQKDEMQHYEHVLLAFPDDPKLQRWNAVSYIGVPISSPLTGEMLGIMVIINDDATEINPDLQYLLTILSLRAGAELLRQISTDELEAKETQFENITRNSPGVIFEFKQGANGINVFTYVSASSKEVLEIAPIKLVNSTLKIYDIVHPDDQESFLDTQSKNLKNPKPAEWMGRIITDVTKTIKWVKISSQPDVLDNGDIIWYGIIDDIDHQKEIEHALELAKEEAIEAANAKEDFLATMSHEIRTPLNAIYGISELLRLNDKTSQMEEVELLRYSSENLLSLINNILDFSKLKAGKLSISHKPFDLKLLFESISKSSRFLAKRTHTKFDLQFDKRIPEVAIGDELILSQILHNLLSNAHKFTENGLITLSAKLLEDAERTFKIAISVSDTGEGIHEKDLAKIFSKFEQSEHDIASKGTGLGLTITKALLQLQNSSIQVQSKKGEGSTFSFELELDKYSGEKEQNMPDSIAYKHHSTRRIKVLMADDNEDNRLLVSKYFAEIDHIQLELALNGEDCIKMVSDSLYDVVLMDMRMPVMNGLEATKIIRGLTGEHFKNLPIIALTADTYGVPEEAEFTDIMTKPFKFNDLLALIEKYGTVGS